VYAHNFQYTFSNDGIIFHVRKQEVAFIFHIGAKQRVIIYELCSQKLYMPVSFLRCKDKVEKTASVFDKFLGSVHKGAIIFNIRSKQAAYIFQIRVEQGAIIFEL
jgi:hypothetical protein